MSKLDILKDYLELVRNFVFAGGLMAIGGTVFYEPELGTRITSKHLAEGLFVAAFVYMLLAIVYVLLKHLPAKPGKWRQIRLFCEFFVLIFIFEGTLGFVARHIDLNHKATSAHIESST